MRRVGPRARSSRCRSAHSELCPYSIEGEAGTGRIPHPGIIQREHDLLWPEVLVRVRSSENRHTRVQPDEVWNTRSIKRGPGCSMRQP